MQMDKESIKFDLKRHEIESELYSILKSIPNLHQKYQKGSISENFFHKSIKNAINGLLNIKIFLKEEKIFFSDYIKEVNLVEEYNNAINIINKLSSLNYTDDSSIATKSSLLELPGITSEITSSFITLIDALKLDSLHDNNLITKLFTELRKNFSKFPGLDEIKHKIDEICEFALDDASDVHKKINYDVIANELYSLFLAFQETINWK